MASTGNGAASTARWSKRQKGGADGSQPDRPSQERRQASCADRRAWRSLGRSNHRRQYREPDTETRARRIIPHIRRRGESPLLGCIRGKPRRWVVERTNSWHNRVRWPSGPLGTQILQLPRATHARLRSHRASTSVTDSEAGFHATGRDPAPNKEHDTRVERRRGIVEPTRFRHPPVAPDMEIYTIRRSQPSHRSGLCDIAAWTSCRGDPIVVEESPTFIQVFLTPLGPAAATSPLRPLPRRKLSDFHIDLPLYEA